MPQKNGLTRKQEIFLNALLEGSTIVASAKEAGVTNQTAHNWLDTPEFAQVYEKSRKQLLNQSLANLHAKFGKAVDTLERHLDEDSGTIPRDQLKSAEIVVNTTIQTAQLIERIAELEALVAQREQEDLYTVKFDLRKVTPDERDILRRMNADIAVRENPTV
jgi:phage terminase small subunit